MNHPVLNILSKCVNCCSGPILLGLTPEAFTAERWKRLDSPGWKSMLRTSRMNWICYFPFESNTTVHFVRHYPLQKTETPGLGSET